MSIVAVSCEMFRIGFELLIGFFSFSGGFSEEWLGVEAGVELVVGTLSLI